MFYGRLFQIVVVPARNYAAKSGVAQISGLGKKGSSISVKGEHTIELEVEGDTNKLLNYVCGTNLFVEGGEDVKVKPDSEYPDWLWSIEKRRPLEELDRNLKEYWTRAHCKALREEARIARFTRTATVHK